jgi:serine/threonine protein kinase
MWILSSGDLFDNRYRVQRELGAGGMSHVYAATDEELGETVALKIIKPEFVTDQEFVSRFKREVLIARQIRHPNVIHVYEFGYAAISGRRLYYLTMELLEGRDLRVWLDERGSVSLSEILSVGLQLCDALGEAHRLGVIHRDIKPQNIFVDESAWIKLMDFGICRPADLPTLTQGYKLLGTPRYMAPEQFHFRTEPDHRSDLYSVGVLLFELCTGRTPFEGKTVDLLAMKKLEEIPRHPRELNPRIPIVLDRIIMTCLEKDPGDRYQSARQLKDALRAVPAQEEIAHRVLTDETESYSWLPTESGQPVGPTSSSEEVGREPHTTTRNLGRGASFGGKALVAVSSLIGLAVFVAIAVFLYGWFSQGIRSKIPEIEEATSTTPPTVAERRSEPEDERTPIATTSTTPATTTVPSAPSPQDETASRAEEPIDARRSEVRTPVPSQRPAKGRLRVTSTPNGAAVAVDGETVGKTPWSDELDPGTYRLRLSHPQHAPTEETVRVQAGEVLHRVLQLEPRIQTTARVRVSANPGTQVYVDGNLVGTIPPVVELTMDTGRHEIRYVIPDYDEFEETIEVVFGETNEFAHRFALFGGLRILAQPYARVFLDGTDMGFTPINIDKLSEGSHQVKLEREGYQTIEQSITVQPGQINRFQFELVLQKP